MPGAVELADRGCSAVEEYYREARAEADAWQSKRVAFMEGLFKKGMHPDTHPGFWDGFDGGDPPSCQDIDQPAIGCTLTAMVSWLDAWLPV
ncbi:MAG: hypothetical protein R3F19_30060 [Verrucomicrobiales bacterium]